jgi:hypothetical protein
MWDLGDLSCLSTGDGGSLPRQDALVDVDDAIRHPIPAQRFDLFATVAATTVLEHVHESLDQVVLGRPDGRGVDVP